MSNGLKALRERLKSVKSTQKMTAAMRMIASAKLRNARHVTEAATAYTKALQNLIVALRADEHSLDHSSRLLGNQGQFVQMRTSSWIPQEEAHTHGHQIHALVVITSDRGLCGSFNSLLIRRTREWVHHHRTHGNQFRLICIGRKGWEAVRGEYKGYILKTYTNLPQGKGAEALQQAAMISQDLSQMLHERAFDCGDVLFTGFQNMLQQTPVLKPFLPLNRVPLSPEDIKAQQGHIYIYEPRLEEMIDGLVLHILESQVYEALLQSRLSEYAARMQAMDAANRNASDMIDQLTLTYNRTRQGLITRELVEIISGAEALVS